MVYLFITMQNNPSSFTPLLSDIEPTKDKASRLKPEEYKRERSQSTLTSEEFLKAKMFKMVLK